MTLEERRLFAQQMARQSRPLKVSLSEKAKQALAWLFSDQAKNLTAAEARASILDGFGKAVDDELREHFKTKEL